MQECSNHAKLVCADRMFEEKMFDVLVVTVTNLKRKWEFKFGKASLKTQRACIGKAREGVGFLMNEKLWKKFEESKEAVPRFIYEVGSECREV